MQQRATAPWESKECGASKAVPVTECDLIVRGVANGEVCGYLFEPLKGMYRSIEKTRWLNFSQIIALATKSQNSLTFTCVPPGTGKRRLIQHK